MHRPLALVLLATAALPSHLAAQDPSPKPTTWTGVLDEAEFKKLHDLRAEQAPPARGTEVTLGDGSTAYLSLPEHPGPHTAGIVVIHEWWGLNDHVRHWTDRLAADGYAALAVDLYDGKVATTRDEAANNMGAVDESKALNTLHAAMGFLADDSRVRAKKRACIGWCFGGGWSLRLAIAEPRLDAAVIYYGRLDTDPTNLGRIRAPILGVFGNQDRGIPKESVDAFAAAMTAAGRELVLHRFDADHAFANPSSARYEEKAASAAWQATREFLAKHLRPSAAPDAAAMRTYVLGLLKAGPTRGEKLEPKASATLQEQHLAHIAAMAKRGEIVVAGPMTERPGDDPIIGILLFTVPKEQAEALAAQDPLVKAGRLRCELIGWYGPRWLVDQAPK